MKVRRKGKRQGYQRKVEAMKKNVKIETSLEEMAVMGAQAAITEDEKPAIIWFVRELASLDNEQTVEFAHLLEDAWMDYYSED